MQVADSRTINRHKQQRRQQLRRGLSLMRAVAWRMLDLSLGMGWRRWMLAVRRQQEEAAAGTAVAAAAAPEPIGAAVAATTQETQVAAAVEEAQVVASAEEAQWRLRASEKISLVQSPPQLRPLVGGDATCSLVAATPPATPRGRHSGRKSERGSGAAREPGTVKQQQQLSAQERYDSLQQRALALRRQQHQRAYSPRHHRNNSSLVRWPVNLKRAFCSHRQQILCS